MRKFRSGTFLATAQRKRSDAKGTPLTERPFAALREIKKLPKKGSFNNLRNDKP
ncbi:MAG TPA: hypothetical protein VFD56_07450 [Chitinophagaceae bacterium]|nr:hypothetical protein [Chitinophagaceae bacterium]